MFGRKTPETIGLPVRHIIAEGSRNTLPSSGWGDAALTACAGQAQGLCLLTGLRADGSPFAIEATVSQHEIDGRPIFMGILRDASARLRALDSLRQSEKSFSETFSNSPIGLMCVTPDGTIEQVNEAQLSLLERPIEEVVGKSVADLHTDGGRVATLLACLAKGETVHNLHLQTWTPDGPRHLLIDANGVWTRNTLACSRWFIRDTTSRIELEREVLTIADAERRRIGHDLHDDVCQQLAAIEFMVEARAAGSKPSRRQPSGPTIFPSTCEAPSSAPRDGPEPAPAA